MQRLYIPVLILTFLLAATACYFSWQVASQQQEEVRVGYADYQTLVDGFSGMQEATASYEDYLAQEQVRIDSIQQRFTELQLRFNTPDLTQEAAALIQQEMQLLNQLYANTEKKLYDRDQQVSAMVARQLRDLLAEYAKAHEYDAILVINQEMTLSHLDTNNLLTQPILTYINAAYNDQ